MPLHMEGKMVAPRERPLTQVTLERFSPGVLAVMPCQLIRPRKLPPASLPGALIGLLSRVGPLVGLKVGAFGVHLVTAFEVTLVNLPPLQALSIVDGHQTTRKPCGRRGSPRPHHKVGERQSGIRRAETVDQLLGEAGRERQGLACLNGQAGLFETLQSDEGGRMGGGDGKDVGGERRVELRGQL